MDVWPRCLQRLEAELPQEDVRTWLKPLQADRRDRQLVLYAPNAFVMEEVRSHYLPRIRELAAHFGDAEVSLDIGAMRRAEPAVPATGTGVRAAVASGALREDLYFRLAGVRVEIPPLRARRDELVSLLESHLERAHKPPRIIACHIHLFQHDGGARP